MTPLPDLDSLRCFLAGAQQLNFRAAATQVSLSPAAFSDRIKRLEALLRVRLFERSTRRVALTPAGHRLLSQAQRTLAEAAACIQVVQADERPTPYNLTLGTRFELGLSWLQPALDPLQVQCPERTLSLSFGTGADLLERLRRGQIDAVITSTRLTQGALEYALLHEEEYCLCGTPANLKTHALGGPADAGHHTLVDIGPDLPLFRYFMDARPAKEVWGFHDTAYLGTISAMRAHLLTDRGVGVLPTYFVRPDIEAGRLVPLFPKMKLRTDHFRLIWRRGHPRTPALRALGDALRQMPLR